MAFSLTKRPRALLDIECYTNYFLICIRRLSDGRTLRLEQIDSLHEPLDKYALVAALQRYTIVGFNINKYDIPMAVLALNGARNCDLKAYSDRIIMGNMAPWQLEDWFGVRVPAYIDGIDMAEPAPGVMIPLKLYAGRMHSKRIWDLPYEPDAVLSRDEMVVTGDYCGNDLDVTGDLLKALEKQIELREQMSVEYGVDLRSKSDAQVAEAVIRSEVEKLKGRKIYRPEIPPGTRFRYKVPAYLKYRTQVLQDVLAEVAKTEFVVEGNGSVDLPESLNGRKIPLGRSVYTMGIGGLHSTESRQSVVATPGLAIIDRDVASYYPAIILNQGLAPQHLGEDFLKVYRTIVARRLAAKKAGDKVVADSLKITINGSFGKLGSKWSVLYAPDLMIQVTVTGQLSLLLFIEMLELAGITVISANTDGVVSVVPAHLEPAFARVVAEWERVTGFETEETRYAALHSRDVNSYLAVKTDGKCKGKGAMQTDPAARLMKNPAFTIVQESVEAFLSKGLPIGHYIRSCTDVRKFLAVKRVTGGGSWRGKYLGKTVRWYRSNESVDYIGYAKKTNNDGTLKKVGGSDNAVPMMTLLDSVPGDIDYQFYVREAVDLLSDLGYGR